MTAKGGTTNGRTMLPSGILMKWASVNITGLQTINANSFGKAFTTLYSIQLTEPKRYQLQAIPMLWVVLFLEQHFKYM
jgi:hypothetical protein